MRPQRRRTKKLTVAFHFQYVNQAAWRCDECRRNGLEHTRRCGWLPRVADERERVVWARRGRATFTCPVSYITADSVAWIEEFSVWKLMTYASYAPMPARTVEAFCILENEVRMERSSAEF